MEDNLVDKPMKCTECSEDFLFTADEQKFHREKGYTNEPKRCPKCRQNRRGNFGGSGGGGGNRGGFRERVEAICADCGQKTTVPFKPVLNKPVYCDSCFAKIRGNR